MKKHSSDRAPAAIGPYSQAISTGKLIYTSGVIPIVPETGAIAGAAVEVQTRQALLNLSNLLEDNGSSLEKVIKTTVFIKDMRDFKRVNDVYATFFKEPYPARSCVEVARLPKDVKIEIEAIAEKSENTKSTAKKSAEDAVGTDDVKKTETKTKKTKASEKKADKKTDEKPEEKPAPKKRGRPKKVKEATSEEPVKETAETKSEIESLTEDIPEAVSEDASESKEDTAEDKYTGNDDDDDSWKAVIEEAESRLLRSLDKRK